MSSVFLCCVFLVLTLRPLGDPRSVLSLFLFALRGLPCVFVCVCVRVCVSARVVVAVWLGLADCARFGSAPVCVLFEVLWSFDLRLWRHWVLEFSDRAHKDALARLLPWPIAVLLAPSSEIDGCAKKPSVLVCVCVCVCVCCSGSCWDVCLRRVLWLGLK